MTTTILFLSANPANTEPLELIKECNKIDEELRYAAGKDKFNFEQHHDISLDDLRKQILLHNPQIIHFSGHGSEESELIFKGKNGEVQTVPQGALSEFFEILGKDISLVFLNACYSEEQASAISKHVNFVIGMSRAISDEAAIKFAVSFYSSFGFGKSVEDSFRLAKVDLKFQSIPEEATPKLLVKNNVHGGIDKSPKIPKTVYVSLLNAIESLFKGTSIQQEVDKLNSDKQETLYQSSQTGVPITSKEDLLSGEINIQEWENFKSRIDHLVSLMDIHTRNYYRAREQQALWGSAMVPPIIANTLDESIKSISDITSELKEVLTKVFGKKFYIGVTK